MTAAARNYVIVTASYWGFTLTDGALRMLVLLHFFKLGYSPFTLALLFLLYELAGIVANLWGGWLAVRFGIPRMLMAGQLLQVAGLVMLSFVEPGWSAAMAVAWVVAAQGIAGLAKDFTKTASKSAIKATSGEGAGQLFRLVAWFTGSKNAMKGAGFFVGLAARAFLDALAELQKARRQRPQPVPRFDGAPAQQHALLPDRHRADDVDRVFVMDLAATAADRTFAVVVGGHAVVGGLAAGTAMLDATR